jgi:hypothetical protein
MWLNTLGVSDMTIRVRLTMQWAVTLADKGLPFSKLKHFRAFAKHTLEHKFRHSDPATSFRKTERLTKQFQTIEITFDVNLESHPTGYYDPESYTRYATAMLVKGMGNFASYIQIDAQRFPNNDDVDGATDLVPWDDEYRDRYSGGILARLAEEDGQNERIAKAWAEHERQSPPQK